MTRPDVIAQHPKEVEQVVQAWLKVDDAITSDEGKWSAVIVKLTGTSKAIADESIQNLYPDRKIYRATAVAIADMMRQLHYIQHDISSEIQNHIDYRFLEQATGKSKSDLGY